MNKEQVLELGYEKIKDLFSDYIDNSDLEKSTKTTRKSDAFYLYRSSYNYDFNRFVDLLFSDDFENGASQEIKDALNNNSSADDPTKNVSAYKTHLKALRDFIFNISYQSKSFSGLIKGTIMTFRIKDTFFGRLKKQKAVEITKVLPLC